MRSRSRARRPARAATVALVALAVAACGRDKPPAAVPPVTQSDKPTARFPDPTEKSKPQTDLLKNEIPAGQLDETVRAHLEGLGRMERYEYRQASRAFREVHERAPGWVPGSVNLAIALLNDTGVVEEKAKAKAGGDASAVDATKFDEPFALLDDVIRRDPNNLSAHYCRGLILEFLGRRAEAQREFVFVTGRDPDDAHAWFKVAATLGSKDEPERQAGPKEADQVIALCNKALDRNPYLLTAIYKLGMAYGISRQRDKQIDVLTRWRRLNPKEGGDTPAASGETDMMGAFYGGEGKYAQVINPFPASKAPAKVAPPPRFDPPAPVKITLADGDRWATDDDFKEGAEAVVGRARARFGATVAAFDADGDGRTDLFLAAAVKGPNGVRDALLLNKGGGTFEDVSRAWGLPDRAPSLGAAAADFDADRLVDLFLCGPSGYHLLRNAGRKFEDVTEKAGIPASKSLGLSARWLDLDQDGDLDLYVINYTSLERMADAFVKNDVEGASNSAYQNVGKPPEIRGRPTNNYAPIAVATADLHSKEGMTVEFVAWPGAEALAGPAARHTGVAALYLDDDNDLDLVLSADGAPARAVFNDRLGKFHASDLAGPDSAPLTPEASNGLLVADFDKDGRDDLAAPGAGGRVLAWRNAGTPKGVAWEPWPTDAKAWKGAWAADLDLDSWTDLVGLPGASEVPALDWSRNDGAKGATAEVAAGPLPEGVTRLDGFALVDLAGDPLPDLVLVVPGGPPMVARNLGNGRHWLAIDLGGRWKTSFDHMRTNPHGIGTRLSVQGQGLLTTYDHTTQVAGLGQSAVPFVLGLDQSPSAELIRLRWPDGTMQCELNEKADTKLALTEFNRKTGSCPVLFTWNGERYECLGDFLGGGGLGYLVAPGVYGQPDRDESVAIAGNQLRDVDGVFRMSITEPMDEVAYLDRLDLEVVDRPPGVFATPDERFAPEGPRPTGEVIAWKTTVEPEKATDLKGNDVTDALRRRDRVTADEFRRLDGWVGYAEEHGIVLDFGDRLKGYGPDDPLVLVLAGWVEYPYSQTNYAASTAGVALKPPSVERRNDDGTWAVIEPNAGYPAGLPRLTTLDLTGKLNGPRCVVRLRTNMECYYDQAFVAPRDRHAEGSLRKTTLPVARASLGHRGYCRESSPDGRLPLLYEYDRVDPAPLALMGGRLTRHGDVLPLLTGDDDRLCLVGPGDEVRLEFDAKALPALPEGWSRGYVLKSVGYCKDADPYTAGGDSVEPLPWRAMPPYPFTDNARRPPDDAYRAYLETYQTRPAGAR